MYRTHTCGELRFSHQNQKVTLCGWVQRIKDRGQLVWVVIRDRYGVTQLIIDERCSQKVWGSVKKLSREFVIQVKGVVIARESKNYETPTGEIEVLVENLTILNSAKTPPFTIENQTDGGEELRMKYRYLDIRRTPVKEALIFRSRVAQQVRNYLSAEGFIEIETPYLIKSTPEGARDFVVPSRMNKGQFYALPQSPQTFKQLLMIGGMDKYFQLVKCFRDEDLRADRQPEFTQIDCEMSFVEQEDVLHTFEGLVGHLMKEIRGIEVNTFPRMAYGEALRKYGTDKPDLRFGMEFVELNDVVRHRNFKVFNEAELVVGIVVSGAASMTRKEIDRLTHWVKQPQIGAEGMVYVKCNEDGSFKSSVDKFYTPEDLAAWAEVAQVQKGDLMVILSGDASKTRAQLSALRVEIAERLSLRKPDEFAPLWVVDFPLLEWDEENSRYYAMHHPFTSPLIEDIPILEQYPGKVRANAYDLVLNGNEIGGGSIRIHERELQEQMFHYLGFTQEKAEGQFGFLMDAFQYGAPPHGGIALGFDRLVAILSGQEIIRDFIAFPKNNKGRDVMINAPSFIDKAQLDELALKNSEE